MYTNGLCDGKICNFFQVANSNEKYLKVKACIAVTTSLSLLAPCHNCVYFLEILWNIESNNLIFGYKQIYRIGIVIDRKRFFIMKYRLR